MCRHPSGVICLTRSGDTLPVQLGEGRLEIESVPVDDGIEQQVQPGRPVELTLEGPVSQFSEPVEEQRTGQGVLGFALVEAGRRVPAHFGVLPPLRQTDGPIDATESA